jgi:hypothetical protein
MAEWPQEIYLIISRMGQERSEDLPEVVGRCRKGYMNYRPERETRIG